LKITPDIGLLFGLTSATPDVALKVNASALSAASCYPAIAGEGARLHAWSRVKRVIPWRIALPSISGRNGEWAQRRAQSYRFCW
jgi:hypothetical protein